MFENRWSLRLDDLTARYFVRGYFSGDGQHWTRVYDRETGLYLPGYHREAEDAIAEAERAVAPPS